MGRDARAFEVVDANAREKLTREEVTESYEEETSVAFGVPLFRKVVKTETVEYDGDLLIHKPGAYMFVRWRDGEEPCGVAISCPCGCGRRRIFHFAGRGKEPDQPGVKNPPALIARGAGEWMTAPHVGVQHEEWTVGGVWPGASLDRPIEFPAANGHAAWRGRLAGGVFVED